MTSDAQRAAQARADAKRPAPVPVRLNATELAWLDGQRREGEGRGTALKRLAGMPWTAANDKAKPAARL